MLPSIAYQSSGRVDACGPGVGAVQPSRLGEAEQAVRRHFGPVPLLVVCAVAHLYGGAGMRWVVGRSDVGAVHAPARLGQASSVGRACQASSGRQH